MRKVTRIGLLILLLASCVLSLPSPRLAAQTAAPQEEGPAAFVPTEKLPAGSAVSFPTDI
jgi:hypothetical protein